MSSKWLASVLFAMLTASTVSCTDAPSTAKDYLAKNQQSADSADQESDLGDEDESSNSGDEESDETEEEEEEVVSDEDEITEDIDDVGEEPTGDRDDGEIPVVPAPIEPVPVVTGPTVPTPAAITYADVRTKFFIKYCTACHGNSGGISLLSYMDVKNNLAKVKSSTLVDKSMPKGPDQPSAAELKLLSDWINAGAPER